MANLILQDNLSSDPSSPTEGLIKRVNGSLKIADSNGNMQLVGEAQHGSWANIPSSLEEGEFYTVTEEPINGKLESPQIFTGPLGGGTPLPTEAGLNIYFQLSDTFSHSLSVREGGGGVPPYLGSVGDSNGNLDMTESSTGFIEANASVDSTYISDSMTWEGPMVDFGSGVMRHVTININTNGDISANVEDLTQSNVTPQNAFIEVYVAQSAT